MFAKSPLVLLTAALALVGQTVAAPAQDTNETVLELVGEYHIDDAYTDSAFIKCLKAKNAYDEDGSMDQDAALECRHAFDEENGLHARTLPSTFETPEPQTCGKNIPNIFEEAAPFRDIVDTVCDDLVGKLMKKGWEKGGNAIQHKFGNAFHKKNSWLDKNKEVLLEVALSMNPQTRAALKSAKVAKATLDTLCNDGLKKLGTKGSGCTEELGYYKKTLGVPGAGIPYDHATTTAVKNGIVDLFTNNAKDYFGQISLNFKNA
ncbi:hypothetical protein ASPWEDRAFT_182772 [Aspergillus wentii DTO 134E9]|uniref:Uncharacterized protein n=1 Tax=Aspergillus wentii DTO 134E9 TaxID=1073089 RepID=A0A1L9RSU3_ASPWE|nr:uncharacterized protein ASPWEDRAFT_182772 [Aspergillus wentii DTO 134E9]KAI9930811.1 hypothetical protein MW887_011569 [Aspergillus wentii]OJJ37989.1 hypothetical protein ASPWEDRAFT_182772 [Aspergillus wentii DTO 134E9]